MSIDKHAISDCWKSSLWEVFRTHDGRKVAIVPGHRLARLMCHLANAIDRTHDHGGLDYPCFDYERPGYGWLLPPGGRARHGWPDHLPLRDGELHTWTAEQLDEAIVDWDATDRTAGSSRRKRTGHRWPFRNTITRSCRVAPHQGNHRPSPTQVVRRDRRGTLRDGCGPRTCRSLPSSFYPQPMRGTVTSEREKAVILLLCGIAWISIGLGTAAKKGAEHGLPLGWLLFAIAAVGLGAFIVLLALLVISGRTTIRIRGPRQR